MSDRELLELAAKAAGFGSPDSGAVCWTESEYPRRSGLHGALWNYVGHMDTAELWNPLTDDGDALRLAVKLQMHVYTFSFGMDTGECVDINTWSHSMRGLTRCLAHCVPDGDFLSATRRAIVRAAAEIGKAMP